MYVPTNNRQNGTCLVIGGEYLIRKFTWQFPTTYEEICKQFFKYIIYHYGKNSTIILIDSYDEYFYPIVKILYEARHFRIITAIIARQV